MGANFAHDLASGEFGLSLKQAVRIHLTANHYPPVPESMVTPCLDAIDHAVGGDWDARIDLPEGVSWRGEPTAPAYAIIESHHLGEFVFDIDDE